VEKDGFKRFRKVNREGAEVTSVNE